MNIFYLDSDPCIAAQSLCDKHVVKMILESTQLLCNALPENSFPGQYKRTHYNHPCSVWVRESSANFYWLHTYLYYLCEEYYHRYTKIHSCDLLLNKLADAYNIHFTIFGTFSPPPQCMPDQFKITNRTIKAYRNYYHHKAITIKHFRYSYRNPPEWLKVEVEIK